jgi:hypothetical protein
MPSTGFWDSYFNYIHRMRERRIQRQTAQAIAELPPHILRDIGWPAAYEQRNQRGRGK